MKGDFHYGSISKSSNLLSDVEKTMAMALRSCCGNPLHGSGIGFDGWLVPKRGVVRKINQRASSSLSSSSSSLDMLAEVATQQLMELEGGNGLTTNDINIPKKKRSSMRRTQIRILPHASHDSVQSVRCMNMKRKRISSHSGSDRQDYNNEALVQKKQKLVHVQSSADLKLPSSPKPKMPQDMKNMISRSGGGDLKLVIEKELFDTDVADNNQQFSIPMKQVKEDFLSEKDQTELKLRSGHNERVQLWSMSRKSQLRFALVKVSTTKPEVQQCGHGASTCSSSQSGQTGSFISCISQDC
ncbi:unnamed protein product [Prunus armeniaca]|uniref:Uncharacterized protein n=1 Tax=Prunus armeniaca TaxID=36596 RepID=A0A6J5WBY7_PRUAR|nr:unnamed protein product [Prunus armeniaca]